VNILSGVLLAMPVKGVAAALVPVLLACSPGTVLLYSGVLLFGALLVWCPYNSL